MKKLNIGCGDNWRKTYSTYEGLDIIDYGQEYVGDVLAVLSTFGSETYDKVMANHFLEHFNQDDLVFIFERVHNILKKGKIFKIVVPHKSKAEAWDLTHKTFWNENTITTLGELPNFGNWSVEKVVTNKRKDIHAWLKKN